MTPYGCKSCGEQQVFLYPVSDSNEGGLPPLANTGATVTPIYRRATFWEGVLASLFATAVLLAVAWFAGSEAVRGLVRDEMQKADQKGAQKGGK